MKLIEYPRIRQQSDNHTAVLFVHGLLGDHQDWSGVVEQLGGLTDARCFGVDLPAHGADAASVAEVDYNVAITFDAIGEQLRSCCQAIIQLGVSNLVLVGYSLGARVLMFALTHHYLQFPELKTLVIEGGNFGLESDQLRIERRKHDKLWAQRFNTMSAEKALSLWYQQPVFSDVSEQQRQALIAQRKRNRLSSVALILEATSLGKQPYLLPKLLACDTPLQLIVGEKDSKFRTLYTHSGIPTTVVPNAGHNTHKDNPRFVANTLAQWL